MQPIAPRLNQARQQPILQQQQPQRPSHQHQHQHQLQQQPPQPQTQFQERAHQPASAQGHASSSDRSIQMLREPMDTSPPHYAPAEVMHHTSTANSSPTDPQHPDQMALQESPTGDSPSDSRKGYGKRELSTSKRAAQNRAAQRAFRQRKEGYIKKLEEQVREYGVLSESFKNVQQENYQLRDYIIALQSRLLEAQGEVPPPPGGLDGLQPGSKQQQQQSQQHQSLGGGLLSQQGPSAVQHQHHHHPHQLPGAATLPRLSELGAPPQQPLPQQQQQHMSSPGGGPPQPLQPQAYDTKMTPAQAALQGPSILHSPSGGPR